MSPPAPRISGLGRGSRAARRAGWSGVRAGPLGPPTSHHGRFRGACASAPQSREPGPGRAQGKVGPAATIRGSDGSWRCRGARSGPGLHKLPLPSPGSLGPTAAAPFPSSSSLCTLAPGAGGRGGGWSFTFFRSSPSCRKLHQMTRAGSTGRSPPRSEAGWAGEFPGRRDGVGRRRLRVGPVAPAQQAQGPAGARARLRPALLSASASARQKGLRKLRWCQAEPSLLPAPRLPLGAPSSPWLLFLFIWGPTPGPGPMQCGWGDRRMELAASLVLGAGCPRCTKIELSQERTRFCMSLPRGRLHSASPFSRPARLIP